jgi:nucleolar protein 15
MKAKLDSLANPEWDSSDSEDDAASSKKKAAGGKKATMPSGDVVSLDDKKAAAKATMKEKRKAARKAATLAAADATSVIYMGHLPVGFEESEITGFLSQFGDVEAVHVSRSKRTGNSRGYGFVKFVDAEVAKIVAETMQGYFLLERRLVCHVLPSDKVNENMFKGKFRKVDWRQEHAIKMASKANARNRSVRQSSRLTARLDALRAMGIDVGTADEVRGIKRVAEEIAEDKEEEAPKSSKKARKGSVDKGKEASTPKSSKKAKKTPSKK